MKLRIIASLFLLSGFCSVGTYAGNDKKEGSEEPAATIATEPKIIFEADPTLLTSTIKIVILTGASDDPKGKSGLTNLMTELMLRGTTKRNREAFQSEVERMGATIGVHTSQDTTVFVGQVIKENTGKFLKLVEDCLLHPTFSKKEFALLKREVLGDISNLKNANGALRGIALRQYLFAGTNLEQPGMGKLGSVNSITLDDVIRAYHSRIHRGNLLFAAAAPFKEEEVKGTFQAIWKGFPPGVSTNQPSVSPKVPENPVLLVIHKPKTSTGSLMFGQGGLTAADPLRYPLLLGNYSFGSEPLVSRLFKVVRSELGWTYQIGSSYYATGSLTRQEGFFTIAATPSIEFTAKTILKILAMWKEYVKSGLKEEELLLAKQSLINSYPFEFDSAEKRLWQKVYSYLYDVPVLSPEEYANMLNAITNDKLKTALAEKQKEQGWVISLVADKDVIEKQLAEEQKEVPEAQRLKISKVLDVEQLVK